MKTMRLDKLLAHLGYGSRKEVKLLIRRKAVSVNGETVRDDDIHVNHEEDEIIVENDTLSYTKFQYWVLNKPKGVVSAVIDNVYPTVLSCFDEFVSRDVFPVGRLDLDTEGLLLITNDGHLAHHLLSPKHHVEKVYDVTLVKEFDSKWIDNILTGIEIDGPYVCKPAKIEIIDPFHLKLTIMEGKYHQVKRMMIACENEVSELKRISMGPLLLDSSLSAGEYRPLSEVELESLKTTHLD